MYIHICIPMYICACIHRGWVEGEGRGGIGDRKRILILRGEAEGGGIDYGKRKYRGQSRIHR